MKNTIFVGQKNEKTRELKVLLNQITQWCDYIEEVTKIKNVKPNDSSESSSSLNKSRFHFEFVINHYHKIIGSTLCLRTTIGKYNTGGYAPGTDITIHLRPLVLIAYICGFRKDSHMI